MARRRRLTPDDRAVWESVTKTLHRRRSEARADSRPRAEPAPRETVPEEPAPARPADPADCTGFLRPRGEVLRRGASHGGGTEAGGHAPRAPAWPADARPHDSPRGDPLPRPVGRPEAGLDKRTAERLRRGERAPDMRIDLHGMTADRAHRALDRFIAQAIAQGARVVLVITGKGGRRAPEDAPWLPEGRGVLRDAAPRWLRHGPHARRILGVYEAHIRHGGAGAFYVYLKKPR